MRCCVLSVLAKMLSLLDMILLTSPCIFGGMEKGFQMLRRDEGIIPIGTIAERIVGRVAIKKFAVQRHANDRADARPIGVGCEP
jgi:hypothetical protein